LRGAHREGKPGSRCLRCLSGCRALKSMFMICPMATALVASPSRRRIMYLKKLAISAGAILSVSGAMTGTAHAEWVQGPYGPVWVERPHEVCWVVYDRRYDPYTGQVIVVPRRECRMER
jgi:hypothetical protein